MGIGFDVRFVVNGESFCGKLAVISSKAEMASFRCAISVAAPCAIASRITAYMDTLGKNHIETNKNKKEGELVVSLRAYIGGPTYMKDFYEALGIALPSLVEGKEPDFVEIINFVYPAAAGGAAVEDLRVVAQDLYASRINAERVLGMLEVRLYQAQQELRLAKAHVPPLEPFKLDQLLGKVQDIRAEIVAQEAVYNEIFRELSAHFPAIKIPEEGSVVAPIDAGAPVALAAAVGGAYAIPAGRPGSQQTQTYRE